MFHHSVSVSVLPVATPNTPADDPCQTPPTVLPLHHQRSPAVPLAAVLTPGLSPSAHEDVGDPLVLSGVPGRSFTQINDLVTCNVSPVEPHTLAVGDDGQPDLPQDGGDLTVLGQSAPACHCPDLTDQVGVGVGQADGDDVGLELDVRLDLQQRDVVLVGELVEVPVRHHFLDSPATTSLIDPRRRKPQSVTCPRACAARWC